MSGTTSKDNVHGDPVPAGSTQAPRDPVLRPLLSTEEVAVYIGVSRVTIQNWIANAGFPRIKAGRLNRHNLADVQAWLQNNTEPANLAAKAEQEKHRKLKRRDTKQKVDWTLE